MHDGGEPLDFVFSVTETERESNANRFLSPTLYNFHTKSNIFINIFLCLIVLWIFDFKIFAGWNALFIALAFILFDIILGFIDNFLFNIRPYWKEKRLEDVEKLQKYVEFLEEKMRESAKKADKYFETHSISSSLVINSLREAINDKFLKLTKKVYN